MSNVLYEGMIVSMQISAWSGHKLDRDKTRELTELAQADSDAARVNKHLVSKDSLKDVTKAAGALRQFFYRAALPWSDNGDRLLSATAFQSFMDDYQKLKDDYDAAVQEFINVRYPAERARAEFRMGEMFKAEDYPEPESLRARFGVDLNIHGIPTGADFRVQLSEADGERIRREIDAANMVRLRAAMRTVWERVFDVVSHFASKMEGDEKFREATVRNLLALVDDIPALNITNDPDLTALAVDIKTRLGAVSAPELRNMPAAREAARKEAQKIVSKMSGLMAAFGGEP